MLNQKIPVRSEQGRMSLDDYTKIRRLLSESRLDGKKSDQKLQEVVEILEKWFRGIYECVDCMICFTN